MKLLSHTIKNRKKEYVMKKKILSLALALTIVSPAFAIMRSCKVSKNKQVPTPVQEQELTLGVVQKDIKIGSTQEDVAIALGSPNIVTRDSDGKDTWIYDKVSSISSYDEKGIYANIILAGYAKNKGSVQNVQKTLTVVIKFDKKNMVESFTYHMSKFYSGVIMKKLIYGIIFSVLVLNAMPALAKKVKPVVAPAPVKTQLEKRQFQTRTYDSTDKAMIMKAMLNVLQDEGFIVNNANPLLGFISGAKEFDVTDKSIDIEKEFGTSRTSLCWSGVRVAVIEATANVTEYGKEIKVRINFKRKLLNVYGNAQSIDEIDDEKYYQEFFAEIDKAIFIQKQKI